LGLVDFPPVEDDDGTLKFGTVWNEAFRDAILASIEDWVVSVTNPAVKGAAIIDAVEAAKGNLSSLDERLSKVVDPDGNIITSASSVTEDELRATLGNVNLLDDPTFLMWPNGDASPPIGWVNISGSPTIDRAGTGQSDPTRLIGKYCFSITNAGVYEKDLVDTGAWPDVANWLEGANISLGCYVKSSVANHARVLLNDGNSLTASSFHTGNGAWQFLKLTKLISGAATKLAPRVEVAENGTAHFGPMVVMISDKAPIKFQPCPVIHGALGFQAKATPTIGDGESSFPFARPFLIKAVQVYSKTPPSGGVLTIDLERGDGNATWNSIFSAPKDVLADGKRFGNVLPDGDYRYRCLLPTFADNVDQAADRILRVNYDAVNGAADIIVVVRGIQYLRPLEDFLAHND
jgi:hypothetical protein